MPVVMTAMIVVVVVIITVRMFMAVVMMVVVAVVMRHRVLLKRDSPPLVSRVNPMGIVTAAENSQGYPRRPARQRPMLGAASASAFQAASLPAHRYRPAQEPSANARSSLHRPGRLAGMPRR